MTLTNRIVWFLFGGVWLRGRVVRDDPQSQFVAVMVDNDGDPYRQTVAKSELRLNTPPGATAAQQI